MVYQELSLVPALSVAENIFLGKPHRSMLGTVDWREIYREAEKSLADLGVKIDPQDRGPQAGRGRAAADRNRPGADR